MSDLFFKNNPQLETKRLILRKLVLEDAGDVYTYASDEEVCRYMTWDAHKSIEDSKRFINYILGRYEKDDAGEWGIVLKETGKLIGAMGFYKYDMRNSCTELGYVLGRSHWGKGIMPEAVGRLLKFAFEEIGFNRIECFHSLSNEKSGRVMQKVGMAFEGIAKEKIFAKEKYWDVKQYAILKKDWVRREAGPYGAIRRQISNK
jgi:[ribosomal protein S5]-alanine N-acetyltransferase